jgi:trehalose synthase
MLDVLTAVDVEALDPARLAALVGDRRAELFASAAAATRRALDGRAVVNVNSTANGGGVAELLRTLLAYARGVAVDTRWLVIEGSPRFFEITKRLHNHLYGTAGDGGPLGRRERADYEEALAPNAAALVAATRPGDVMLLHDPQTAAMVPRLQAAGFPVVWRCHVGRDEPNEHTVRGWEFLRPYIESADRFVFTKARFAPEWVDPDRLHVITPSIDPFSAKNARLDPESVRRILTTTGVLDATPNGGLERAEGRLRPLDVVVDTLGTGSIPPDAPLVVQLSRWDTQKDMVGVMRGFATAVDPGLGAHLLLSGPAVAGVDDDPEGGGVLAECVAARESLPAEVRSRVHLACVPMHDGEAAAMIANAIQRHATVVAQKSLAEGFGLTVVEAMWKRRAVVASRVGGIVDQIDDGTQGVLIDDPEDLPAFGAALVELLCDPARVTRLGEAAYGRAHEQFLGDRHLERYGALITDLLERS